MKNERICRALDAVTPRPGAEERMYEHIRAGKKGKKRNSLLILAPLAACLVLVLALGLWSAPASPPAVAVGSPVMKVESPEELAPAGVTIEIPEGAEELSFYVISGTVARMEFRIGGISYAVLASGVREDDFTFVSAENPRTIRKDPPATLSRTTEEGWKAELTLEGAKVYLLNDGSADRQQMEQLALSLRAEKIK